LLLVVVINPESNDLVSNKTTRTTAVIEDMIIPLSPNVLPLLMFFLAEILGEKEIIFPETAALVIGALLSPKHIWRVNREKMLLYMSVSAHDAFLSFTPTSIFFSS